MDTDGKLSEVSGRLEEIDGELLELDGVREDAEAQFLAFDEALADIQREIDAALVKGDREVLRREIADTEQQLERIDRQAEVARKEHSGLFRGLSLARGLLSPVLDKALGN